MGLNIKNPEVERLATEAAKRFGESKTEAIKVALQQRLSREPSRSTPEERYRRGLRVLEEVIWPSIPAHLLGEPISKEEREEILGYGPDGF